MKIHNYKDLIIWQKAIGLVEVIYKTTAKFPPEERFGLVIQLRRAAVSIPSNIAEGYGRRSSKEYLQFYAIAYGSALEIETQLIISLKLGYVTSAEFDGLSLLLIEIIKILYTLVYKRKEDLVRLNA